MMMQLDTGICAPETRATLLLQQNQLLNGKRTVQMFPIGTQELELPDGVARYKNYRGVYHYNPTKITADYIEFLGLTGRENLFLNLGPFSKNDIAERAVKGESVTCIVEYTRDGIELRTAVATSSTIPEQLAYFEESKEPDSLIVIGVYPERVRRTLKGY